MPPILGTRSQPIGVAGVSVSIANAGSSAEWSDEAYEEALRSALVDSNVFVLGDSSSPYSLEVEVLQVDSFLLTGLTASVRIHSAWTLYENGSRTYCKLYSAERRGKGELIVDTTRDSLTRGVEALVYYPPGNRELPSIQTRLVWEESRDGAHSHWNRIFEAIVAERLNASGRFRSVTTASQGECGVADYTLSLEPTRLKEQATQGGLIASGANFEATFRLDGAAEGELVPLSYAAHPDDLSYVERKNDFTTLAADRTAKVVVKRVLEAITSSGSY